MASYFLVRILFTNPVRIGSFIKGVGVENAQFYINSDTIFSAMCNVWLKYNILDPSKISSIVNSDSFLISSAFLYSYFERNPIYFLPTPKMEYPYLGSFSKDDKIKVKKLLKSTTFLPSDYIENYFKENAGIAGDRYKIIKSKINSQFQPFQEISSPHHVQDRISSSSQLYYTGQLFNDPKKGGLFFLIKTLDEAEEWNGIFNKGLIALSKEGIGGERSNLGTFLVDKNYGTLIPLSYFPELKFIADNSNTSEKNYILSLYYPIEKEVSFIKNQGNYYDLRIKKGWTFSSTSLVQLKRKTNPFFAEGSIFNFHPKGKVVDVKPHNFPHPVWKWGKAFAISL